MAPRRSRARRSAASAVRRTRTPTPPQPVSEDEEMVNADDAQPETPAQDEAEEEAVEADGDGSAAEDEDEMPQIPSEPSTPPDARNFDPPRKRRLGRPPKTPKPGWDTPSVNDGLETPQRRKRGRQSGFGGRRGRPSAAAEGPKMVRIDKEGTMAEVVDDEVELPEDEEGETKVDKMGNLLGGREYRVRTFTVKNRGKRLYMLSTEPARCCGFRDSYLFFAKHMKLYKVIVDDEEKADLISRDLIPHSYKGRSIGVCTARSVFREFGSRIVVGGRRIVDDYYVEQAREEGAIEGELADPLDNVPPDGREYNKNQYVAWHGASQVYHSGLPSAPAAGKPVTGKRKVTITSVNWQLEHARAASNYNSMIAASRKANLDGIYDPHTNMMHYPRISQHTHVRWEHVDDRGDTPMENGIHKLTNGVNGVHVNGSHKSESHDHTLFPPLNPIVSRNFMVVDTKFESPPFSGMGIPGPDGDVMDVGPNGLSSIKDDVVAELPPECRAAFEEARRRELEWKSKWRGEAVDGARGQLKIGYLGFPV